MRPQSLLIGAGRDRRRQVRSAYQAEMLADDSDLTTLDMNPEIGVDVVWDMENMPLPFGDEQFSECHIYNAAEHWGRQGDWRGWFRECEEYWRILKPQGTLHMVVPIGGDAFADPGHTRFFSLNHFGFLNRDFYERNEVLGTCFTDYRWFLKRYWNILHCETDAAHIYILLQKA